MFYDFPATWAIWSVQKLKYLIYNQGNVSEDSICYHMQICLLGRNNSSVNRTEINSPWPTQGAVFPK